MDFPELPSLPMIGSKKPIQGFLLHGKQKLSFSFSAFTAFHEIILDEKAKIHEGKDK